MKGDIRISKKSALWIAGAISLFAMADYVSIVDSDAAGGIIVERGISESDLDKIMPVGTVTLRMDTINPSTIYGGTWALIEGDAALTFGDGSAQSGLATGNNDPLVPLVGHTHTKGTMNITGSFSIGGGPSTSSYNVYAASGAFSSVKLGSASYGHAGSTSLNQPNNVNLNAASNWTGETSKAGTDNVTLDVRGSRIAINVWQRTN